MITKEQLKQTIADVDGLDLPDGAHWALVHERLGLEYGDAFDIIADDPEFFDATEHTPQGRSPADVETPNLPHVRTPE